MIKLIRPNEEGTPSRIIQSVEMEPLQVARIVNKGEYYGEIVMRTASSGECEIMSLSVPGRDKCWTNPSLLEVELFPPGEKVVLEIFNEE